MDTIKYWALLLLPLLVACSGNETNIQNDAGPPTRVQIDTMYAFLDFETHGIAGVSSMDLLPGGNLAVLDYELHEILLFDPEGNTLLRFGGEGKGPGEFTTPFSVQYYDEKFYIPDRSTSTMAVFDKNGTHVNSFSVRGEAFFENARMAGDGYYLTGGHGRQGALLKIASAGDDSVAYFGEAMGDSLAVFDIQAAQNSMKQGEVPDLMKNRVKIRSDNEYYYVFLDSYHRLRKYDRNRKLIWDVEIGLPVNKVIFDDWMDRLRPDYPSVPILYYIVGMDVRNGNTYLMWRSTEEYPRQLVMVNSGGIIEKIYEIPGDEDISLRDFVVDPARGIMYAYSSGTGTVYKVPLP